MKLNQNKIVFTGGGTGGHIYPGLAVADELKAISKSNNHQIEICWIGCSKGMDKNIVEKATGPDGNPTVDKFYGIPSGKLRRYFSMKNFSDLFRIAGGFFSAYHILRKEKPAVLFSKGGFVSVPPCLAARFLHIPVFTHECDFTLGLANRINFKSADCMFVSYEDTKAKLSEADKKRVVVTGNPVRPVFYNTDALKGKAFLGIKDAEKKPVLLVLGGSSGARQINELVYENIDFLCENYIVVHQTGLLNSDDNRSNQLAQKYPESYKPYNFIYQEMPDVVSAADVILSRAGANSIWEAAVLNKPMVLVPLCGSGTRGDQVDNAEFFKNRGAAEMLLGAEADSEHLKESLTKMLDAEKRAEYSKAVEKLTHGEVPAKKIAQILFDKIGQNQ
ncbi:UDP-N-acetylglucosamine-N-acetylmuramylpentapeptide N-acetylglucosamine transferase [Treponema bryantii]|uniref:UDP-N-acetylglucosamine--N-acetylmuramyl-(pentapeptide) pyrophosphoryl-undecaprenol N-acetylglucosamine transferase n=1 Tax=Treponema bryantii TaxID=163 RepID=A0A1I3KAP7_9SPIR|nr:undecaprenyldiphospho-muramoylpentapeptide beta-N-acetylglucosaminyltransferase [Treponema bryantii]SFI69464.1 UDP-N-acetylglucosamine-N-acetylmuramylpentapeptide N-acetylglucosamine transferase [Treponema bryantii]